LHLPARYRGRFPVRLYSHCLLSNDFHLLGHGAPVKNLSTWMAGLLRAWMHSLQCGSRFVGHLWQDRFKKMLPDQAVRTVKVCVPCPETVACTRLLCRPVQKQVPLETCRKPCGKNTHRRPYGAEDCRCRRQAGLSPLVVGKTKGGGILSRRPPLYQR
jgi:hypothetical protein